MSVIIVLIIICTVLQLVVCHFTFWWILCCLARLLFSMRMIGATFKVRKLAILEGVSLGVMFLFYILFKGDNVPWLRVLFNILFSVICIGLMFIDDMLYVYTIEDVEE